MIMKDVEVVKKRTINGKYTQKYINVSSKSRIKVGDYVKIIPITIETDNIEED